MSPPIIPTLKPSFFFGLTTQVNGNCLFLSENEIVYPASGVLVIYDIDQHRQKYIHLAEPQKVITAMALCINKYDTSKLSSQVVANKFNYLRKLIYLNYYGVMVYYHVFIGCSLPSIFY